MTSPDKFWDHIQALAAMASAAPNKQAWLDELAAELPGLTPIARKDLRMQLQALLATLPSITHFARDTGAPPADQKQPAPASTSVPYR